MSRSSRGAHPEKGLPIEIPQGRIAVAFVAVAGAGLAIGVLGKPLGFPGQIITAGYVASYLFGGWFGLVAGMGALRQRRIDIDLLMVLAALGALAINAPFEGGMLLFLFSLSNVLQQYAIGKSRKAIQALMHLRPDTARILTDGRLVETRVEEVRPGQVFVVHPGDRIPLDGRVVEGASEVDEASLTGESAPVAKSIGNEIFGGTINEAGVLKAEVTRVAGESAIARLIRLVEEARSQKSETQQFLDRFEQPYAVGVILLTIAAFLIAVVALDEAARPAFYRAMTLMVAASPCALIISTPAAVLSAIAAGARNGVLFKGGIHVEDAALVKAIAFDKTGTLTRGATELTDVVPLNGVTADELLALAAAVQSGSEHHLARATVDEATSRGLSFEPAPAFRASFGLGVTAEVNGERVHIGNRRYFTGRDLEGAAGVEPVEQRFLAEAKTSVIVAVERDGRFQPVGVLAFADVIRDGAAELVAELRKLGISHVAMITGDNAAVAQHVGGAVGVDEIYADVLPERKVELIRSIALRYGAVAMVGDGVNDAPALAAATVGIAMGDGGTDVALETADIVLVADDVTRIAYAISLSRRTRRILIANIAISLLAIVVMIALILTVGLPLPVAVVGHEGSTVLVSLNGLRLLGVDS